MGLLGKTLEKVEIKENDKLIEPLPDKLEQSLKEALQPDETIHIKIKGAFKEGLICTNKRVLILKTGFMTGQTFGSNTFQSPYGNISGVEVKYGLASGYFELNTGGMQNRPKNYWSSDKKDDPAKAPNCISISGKERAKIFREACNFITLQINKPVQNTQVIVEDIPSQIKKLADLQEAGILTEEEFKSKKTELLSKM